MHGRSMISYPRKFYFSAAFVFAFGLSAILAGQTGWADVSCLNPEAQKQIFGKSATCTVGGPLVPTSTSSPTSSAISSPSPSPSPSVLMKPAEKTKFLSELTRAQQAALGSAKRKIDAELKQLKLDQKKRQAKWSEEEKIKRRKFFEENKKPADRKNYVKEYYQRWAKLLADLKEEKANKQTQCDQEIAKLKNENNENLKDCRMMLDRGERPPEHLWPHGG